MLLLYKKKSNSCLLGTFHQHLFCGIIYQKESGLKLKTFSKQRSHKFCEHFQKLMCFCWLPYPNWNYHLTDILNRCEVKFKPYNCDVAQNYLCSVPEFAKSFWKTKVFRWLQALSLKLLFDISVSLWSNVFLWAKKPPKKTLCIRAELCTNYVYFIDNMRIYYSKTFVHWTLAKRSRNAHKTALATV